MSDKVHIHPAADVTPRPKRGRPRIPRPAPFSHYAGSQDGTRPRCRAKGCQNFLLKDQLVACSRACRESIRLQVATLAESVEYDEKAAIARAVLEAG